MPYLIDGHNLIPKFGLRLDSPDDELKLISLLQDFSRLKRQPVEVYFDGAPAGSAGSRKFGFVRAHFIRLGQTADSAMRFRLAGLGKEAKTYTVVSSDHEVQSAARASQTKFMTSEEFVKMARSLVQAQSNTARTHHKLSPQEIDEWMNIFDEKE